MLVFLRGIQQQNVIHRYFWLAAITSYAIAIAEVAMLLWVVSKGWSSVPMVGTGGALGVITAMYIHGKYIKRY